MEKSRGVYAMKPPKQMRIITLQYIFRNSCLTLSLSIRTLGRIWAFYPNYPFQLYHFSTSRNNSEAAYLNASLDNILEMFIFLIDYLLFLIFAYVVYLDHAYFVYNFSEYQRASARQVLYFMLCPSIHCINCICLIVE